MKSQIGMTRKTIVIILAILFGLAAIGFFAKNSQRKNSPEYTVKHVNKDTGEVVYSTPNITPEKQSQNPFGLILYGTEQIINAGATQAQFAKFRELLNNYSSSVLGNKYNSLTLIPNGLKSKDGQISGRLRLGEGSNIVKIQIKLSGLVKVRVIITDDTGQNGGSYDSGVKRVDPNFYGTYGTNKDD